MNSAISKDIIAISKETFVALSLVDVSSSNLVTAVLREVVVRLATAAYSGVSTDMTSLFYLSILLASLYLSYPSLHEAGSSLSRII